jgi:ethanolamine-phosphate phospho-lyase
MTNNSIGGKLIGDVRGCGLFIGIELVRDRITKLPATAETSILCSRLKDRMILTSIDGRYDNVIVIKPPMCFSIENANQLIDAMMEILPTITKHDVDNFTHTST